MKKKKLNQNLDADFPEEDNELPQKGIERTTVYLIIIFSLTFFILGNATGFLLLKNAKTGIFVDDSFYAVSEKLYQQQAPQGDAGAQQDPGASSGPQQGADGGQYYDADYKVVDDDDKK